MTTSTDDAVHTQFTPIQQNFIYLSKGNCLLQWLTVPVQINYTQWIGEEENTVLIIKPTEVNDNSKDYVDVGSKFID